MLFFSFLVWTFLFGVLVQHPLSQSSLNIFVCFFVFSFSRMLFAFGMDPSFGVLARTPLSPGVGLNGGLPNCRFNETAS